MGVLNHKSPLVGELGAVPMVNVTWDNNIGFNYGIGLALGKWGQGLFNGIYTSYSFSKKGNNNLL